ncbi:T6SS effector amidase Tae4 family protein [uncultured Pedobacter sp.]|uniref:T6SS effector amidase Tae4 family protein n=1 Tax=uncultured Pedobacter sp. TaxID=246139 RepID=UPI0025F0986F|nr:T6SS effector amidase Tae4 family protein [uncultured Pedobacter sp.]
MKKLTLSTGRAMACLILMCLLLAQACRKDRGYLPEHEINNGQLIQHTAIIKWFETSKYAQLLALDWKKARQGIVDGKNVVRIPTLNVDKITKLSSAPSLKTNSLSSNGISNKAAANVNSGNINYNPAHPPELFLIQDGPKGKINSFLLNFIPKSKNSEAGENGIWTGKLLEWNLKGDTILVQQLERSIVKDFYAMKVGASSPSNLNAIVKNNKLQSLKPIKDKQISGFFGWLIDKLGEFIGWAGSAFGLSTYQYYTYDAYNDSFDSEWRLDIDFSWLTGSGTPTTPGTQVTIPPRPLVMLYTGAGLPIYESYAIGYNGGGGGNPGSYNPNDPNNFEPSPIDYGEGPIDDQPHGPNVNFNNLSAQYLVNEGWVTGDANISFINTHKDIADAIVTYTEKIINRTQGDIDFVNWGIEYLNANKNISIEVFKNQFLGKSEGQDGGFNEAYWNDPILSIPKQDLPTWTNFSSNFPDNKIGSPYPTYVDLLTHLGGDVGALYTPGGTAINTCAIRVSYALLKSGISIPNIAATTINGINYPAQTLKDKDGKYYFIRAKELNAWMRRTFGTNDGDTKTPHNANHSKITGAQAGERGKNLPSLLSNKKGIYCLVSSNPLWASGHADLLYDNATCGVECHFGDAPIDWIDIWILN